MADSDCCWVRTKPDAIIRLCPSVFLKLAIIQLRNSSLFSDSVSLKKMIALDLKIISLVDSWLGCMRAEYIKRTNNLFVTIRANT